MDGLRWVAAVCLLVGCAAPCGAQGGRATAAPSAARVASASVIYDGDAFANLAGGVRRGGTYLGSLNLQLTLDGAHLVGWPGMKVFASVLWIHGGRPGDFSGDAQGVSNLAAPPAVTLEEAWLQFSLFASRASVLVGRYDLNSEFYRLQSAGLFLNASFGVGPEFSGSGVAGPSIFPKTSVGARFEVEPRSHVIIRTAVLDGVPVDRPNGSVGIFEPGDGLLLVSEAAVLNGATAGGRGPRKTRARIGRAAGLPPYDDKVAVGAWYYTAAFNDLAEVGANGEPVRHRGSGGLYGLADVVLFRARANRNRRVAAFVEAGLGDARVNRFGAYVGAGLVANGPLPNRPADELGLAVAAGCNGSPFMSHQRELGVPVNRTETAVELSYLAQAAGWLAVQPDVQYVVHPDTDPSRPNAVAFQLRFEVLF